MTKNNLENSIPWRFGPDWPGQRCGAKTRKGTPCQEAGVQAQWTLFPARWEVYRAQDRGWPSAAYSSSYDPWQVHQGEACSGQAFCRARPADASRVGRAGGMVRGPRSSGQELAGLVQIRGEVSRLSQIENTTETVNKHLKTVTNS